MQGAERLSPPSTTKSKGKEKGKRKASAKPEGSDNPHVFGIRHLSPAGAWHLRRFLDEVQPKLVLIEGMSDADSLAKHIIGKRTVPPVAILAYTTSLPVQTLVSPFAEYSPEYQALRWAKENKRKAAFIDLPSEIFLALEGKRYNPGGEELEEEEGHELEEDEDEDLEDAELVPPEPPAPPRSLYDRFAEQANEPDYETFWERTCEHNLQPAFYRETVFEIGRGLREIELENDPSRNSNLIREAYMRRHIHAAVEKGLKPSEIVVVCGAFHSPALTLDEPAMTNEELAALPRLDSKLTLMPYSYFRLSSQSGYGAGNRAPSYFRRMWEFFNGDEGLEPMSADYLSRVVDELRSSGTFRSTAEVIQADRLARTLSALKGGLAPTLRDLHDAAVTVIGQGEPAVVAESFARIDVGTEIGRVPKGVAQTSIQDDFARQLESLRLEKYRSNVGTSLTLDLRENRRVKTEAAAYMDLHRSSFLHRLQLLGISFAVKQASGQDGANWKEIWQLRWTPESEIELVEAVLMGETVEAASGFAFRQRLEACRTVDAAARMVRESCECGLMGVMDQARDALQHLASETSNMVEIAEAANELSLVTRYGDVRQFDTGPLMPLIEELFLQGSLALAPYANCDNQAAQAGMVAMEQLDRLANAHSDLVDEEMWVRELTVVSDADDLNPVLSGFACALLLERGEISTADLAREVSRRLSPGIEADLGAGWFEGLSKRNRYALISRMPLWQELANYVATLEDEEFKRALVFLRRSFGGFSPQEKQAIAENLGQLWGVDADDVAEVLNADLSDDENEALDALEDFDFDDL